VSKPPTRPSFLRACCALAWLTASAAGCAPPAEGSLRCAQDAGTCVPEQLEESVFSAPLTWSSWRWNGPAELVFRRAALELGISYTRARRDEGLRSRVQRRADEMARPRSTSRTDWERVIASERRALSGATEGLIVLYGDSNTHAAFEIFARASRGALIHNEAISGDTSAGILRRIRTIEGFDPSGPSLLSGGTNDLRPLYRDGMRPDRDRVEAALAVLLDNRREAVRELRARTPRARIQMVGILPAAGSVLPASVVRAANERLRALALELELPFLDAGVSMRDRGGEALSSLTTDGIHFTGEGYRRIGISLGLYAGSP
jgi:lysophospholipase L1-like esterase